MIDDSMTAHVHDHMSARRREAEQYRLWIEAAPLHFHNNGPLAATRRSLASVLNRLADAIAP